MADRNSVWIKVTHQGAYVMEHEGDYDEGDTLVHIESQMGDPRITIRQTEEG